MDEINTEEVWESKRFYETAVSYWDKQEATVDGVLGGFGHVSSTDLNDSYKLLQKVLGDRMKDAEAGRTRLVALDCGSGVGRISKELLLPLCAEVDLIEPSAHLLKAAKDDLTGPGPKPYPADHTAERFYQVGIQDFMPMADRYDIIWVQWCLMYLSDLDVISWLNRCASTIRAGGIIVIKENLCPGNSRALLDEEDASIARSDEYLRELFKKANMKLLMSMAQKGFPSALLKVKMYVLRPYDMIDHPPL